MTKENILYKSHDQFPCIIFLQLRSAMQAKSLSHQMLPRFSLNSTFAFVYVVRARTTCSYTKCSVRFCVHKFFWIKTTIKTNKNLFCPFLLLLRMKKPKFHFALLAFLLADVNCYWFDIVVVAIRGATRTTEKEFDFGRKSEWMFLLYFTYSIHVRFRFLSKFFSSPLVRLFNSHSNSRWQSQRREKNVTMDVVRLYVCIEFDSFNCQTVLSMEQRDTTSYKGTTHRYDWIRFIYNCVSRAQVDRFTYRRIRRSCQCTT